MQLSKTIRYFLCLLTMIFISHAYAKTDPTKQTEDNVYTEDKQNIAVTADQPVFTIKLKSNPTTGFSWFLREYDANLLTAVKHKFIGANPKAIGAPGFELWTFKVKPAGFTVPHQTTIRLIYTRPWQGADSSTQLVFRVSTQSASPDVK